MKWEGILGGIIPRCTMVRRMSSHHTTHHESVAEHQWLCAYFSWVLVRYYEATTESCVDLAKTLLRACLHDIEEAYTGDIPKPLKMVLGDDALRELKQRQLSYLEKKMEGMESSLREEALRTWEEAKGDDLEGRIVAISDFLALVYSVLRELELGNYTIELDPPSVERYIQFLLSLPPQDVWKEPVLRSCQMLLRRLRELPHGHEEIIKILEETINGYTNN